MTEFFERADAVAAFGHLRVSLSANGRTVDTPVAHFFGFRAGKVCRFIDLVNSGAFLEALES
jgi:ketosteroid isomerase-like protein